MQSFPKTSVNIYFFQQFYYFCKTTERSTNEISTYYYLSHNCNIAAFDF